MRGLVWLMVLGAVAALAAAVVAPPARAQALRGGVLDPFFGSAGVAKVSAAPSGERESGNAMMLDSAGGVLVGGGVQNNDPSDPNSGWTIVRFDSAGRHDTGFGGGGFAQPAGLFGPNVFGEIQALEPVPGSDDFIAAGTTMGPANVDFTVARYNADGSLDMSFGPADTGFVREDIGNSDDLEDVDVSPDGKITATGSAGVDAAFLRWDSDGVLDPTFDGPGMTAGNGKFVDSPTGAPDDFRELEVEPSGAVRAVGVTSAANSDWLIGRYTATGARDNAFDTDGIVTKDFAGQPEFAGAQLLVNGVLYVVGTTDTDPAPAGPQDRTFAVAAFDPTTGMERPGTALRIELPGDQNLFQVALQRLRGSAEPSAERFLLAGTGVVGDDNGAVLMRLRRVGGSSAALELDPDFGSGGVVVVPPSGGIWADVVADAQNRIVAGGQLGSLENADMGAARLLDVTVRPPGDSPDTPDTEAPGGSLRILTKNLSRMIARRVLVLRASIDEPGSYAIAARANRRPRKQAQGAARRRILLKRASPEFESAGSKRVRLKLTRRKVRRLRGRRRVRLIVRYTRRDLAGNAVSDRVVKTLRRKPRP